MLLLFWQWSVVNVLKRDLNYFYAHNSVMLYVLRRENSLLDLDQKSVYILKCYGCTSSSLHPSLSNSTFWNLWKLKSHFKKFEPVIHCLSNSSGMGCKKTINLISPCCNLWHFTGCTINYSAPSTGGRVWGIELQFGEAMCLKPRSTSPAPSPSPS